MVEKRAPEPFSFGTGPSPASRQTGPLIGKFSMRMALA